MIRSIAPTQALLDELWLDLDQFCRVAGVPAHWVLERAAEGLLQPQPLGPRDDWRFGAAALRRESFIQVRTVVLIALIALSRKFVILDPETSPAKVTGLSFAVLALGAVHWLMCDRDDRAAAAAPSTHRYRAEAADV
jgi:hypothetical protein